MVVHLTRGFLVFVMMSVEVFFQLCSKKVALFGLLSQSVCMRFLAHLYMWFYANPKDQISSCKSIVPPNDQVPNFYPSNMHTSSLISLVLAAVTLALPTDNTTHVSFPIEKRASRPWLDSFDVDDINCRDANGDTADDYRPFLQAGQCHSFQPAESRLGGSWGAGHFGIGSFWAYENDDCTGKVKAQITRKNKENGFCFTLDTLGCKNGDVDNPCYWNSVMGHK